MARAHGRHSSTPWHTARALAIGVVLSVLLLIVLAYLTKPTIERSRAALLQRQLEEILPEELRASMPFADAVRVSADAVSAGARGRTTIEQIILAQPVTQAPVAVIESLAGAGYNGSIRLLVAVQDAGRLLGVRVVEHRETPGLGDAIDVQRSSWIRQFDALPKAGLGTAPGELDARQWQRRQEGGLFDHITGATITSDAVVQSVLDTLRWFHEHRDTVIAAVAAPPLRIPGDTRGISESANRPAEDGER